MVKVVRDGPRVSLLMFFLVHSSRGDTRPVSISLNPKQRVTCQHCKVEKIVRDARRAHENESQSVEIQAKTKFLTTNVRKVSFPHTGQLPMSRSLQTRFFCGQHSRDGPQLCSFCIAFPRCVFTQSLMYGPVCAVSDGHVCRWPRCPKNCLQDDHVRALR